MHRVINVHIYGRSVFLNCEMKIFEYENILYIRCNGNAYKLRHIDSRHDMEREFSNIKVLKVQSVKIKTIVR